MSHFEPEQACRDIWKLGNAYAEARAERTYLENFRKSKKAILAKDSGLKTAAEREDYAYSHSEYIELLEGLRDAVKKEQEAYFKLTSTQLRIEVWRTQEANNRAQNYNQTT